MAVKVKVYDQQGKEIKELELNSDIFAIDRNDNLIAQALRRQQSNARQDTAHSKTRGEIRGGGRKPHPQKGTGRARQGSTRNIHFRGGGVAFGPRNNQNHELNMPKKQRRKALFSVLSERLREKGIIVLDKYIDADGKTKNLAKVLTLLPINGSVLIVTDVNSKGLINQVANNLEGVTAVYAPYLNLEDLLNFRSILFLEAAVESLENTFLTSNK